MFGSFIYMSQLNCVMRCFTKRLTSGYILILTITLRQTHVYSGLIAKLYFVALFFKVLGNHEFDHGVDGLLPYLERLNATMLGANVNTIAEPELGQYVKNHVVIEKKGRKIGIIGVLLRTVSFFIEFVFRR